MNMKTHQTFCPKGCKNRTLMLLPVAFPFLLARRAPRHKNNDCLFHTRCTAWDMNMDMAIVIVNEHHDETWASAWDMNMDMSTT